MTKCFLATYCTVLITTVIFTSITRAADPPPQFNQDIVPLLKRHCVKCHGPTKQEGKLNLAATGGVVRGGKSGSALVPHDADASLIWKRVISDEMPPDAPLTDDEKSLLRRWIVAGAPGLARDTTNGNGADHWAFRKLSKLERPESRVRAKDSPNRLALDSGLSVIDAFVAADLARNGLALSAEANRATQIRRVSFDLTGLPPTPEAIAEFADDHADDAYARMVDRYLASPHFGERVGKIWLDAAGYADSNGYFNADSDRPLAYRYRDYVIRAYNGDKPFDQFVREQIAGDEIAGLHVRNGETLALPPLSPHSRGDETRESSAAIELLEATHYLRNGQDGSGESDGNPDEVRIDRYTVIETTMQNVSTGLLGLTIQCAKCHDHKFEPLTQRDYYSFQAVLIPAFPPEQWVKPNDRFVYASLPGEMESWQAKLSQAEATIAQSHSEIGEWVRQHRPRGTILFADSFDGQPESLANSWSHTAPGDDAPAGTATVNLNSHEAPGAIIVEGRLQLIEGGAAGDKWLSTRMAIDWTPDVVGAAIQATFDLVDNHIGESKPAERIGYMLATHDFNDNSSTPGGNILIDGHPSSSSAVFLDYPGTDSKQSGVLGTSGYVPGRNYGIRITNQGDGKFLLEHLVDWQAEEKTLTLAEVDLPAGGFGFEFCCNRSFVIDNVSIETFAPSDGKNSLTEFLKALKVKRQPLDAALKTKNSLVGARPGKIAWTTDLTDKPPQTHVLLRGNYNTPGDPVEPATYAVFRDPVPSPPSSGERAGVRGPSVDVPTPDSSGSTSKLSRKLKSGDFPSPSHPNPLPLKSGGEGTGQLPAHDTGRRLAFANSITEPDSVAAALLARVQVNRLWQHHFGTGIVATPDNFGVSGSPPSHPELLDWLAMEFVRSGWSTKHVVRLIVNSAAYKQSSATDEHRLQLDPDARRLSRFPVRRLDAEAIRDAMLLASGDLDDRLFGPYIPTARTGVGETIVPEDNPGSKRRSIYLQQKRTQVHSLLQVFDAPSIVFNSTRRPRSTMPLQSLNQLNSDFSVARARSLANRLHSEAASDSERLHRAFVLAHGRPPSEDEVSVIMKFLEAQAAEYSSQPDARFRAWSDLGQMLLIGNPAIYLE